MRKIFTSQGTLRYDRASFSTNHKVQLMKKLLTSCLLAVSIALLPTLKAEELSSESDTGAGSDITEETVADQPITAETKSYSEGGKFWTNFALGAGAVVVAVAAMLLIQTNDGHHFHPGNSTSSSVP